MRISRTPILSLLAAGALAGAVGVTTAGAAPGPVPGCAGITVKDPAGDQTANQQEAPKNTDVRELFFRNDGGVTTANIRLTEVSKTVPSPYSSIVVYVFWKSTTSRAEPPNPAIEDNFVSAEINSDGTTTFGGGERGTNNLATNVETTGSLAEGADGVITIVVPPAMVPKDKKIPTPIVDARLGIAEPITGRGVVSRADDTPAGKTYTVGGCADGGAVANPNPTPTDPGTPPPSGAPTPAPTGPSGGGDQKPAPSAITIDITKVKAKGKVVSIGLRSSEPLTSLSGTLRKGRKKLGTGKLAKLASTGTMKVKVKKKARKGKYAFALIAKDSAGHPVKANFTVKVK